MCRNAITENRGHCSAICKGPEALSIPAWGEAPRTDRPTTRGLKARPTPPSIPQIPLVALNPILLQKRPQLILERPLAMMRNLSIDVVHQCLQIRRPDRKGAVSSLPGKFRQRLRLRLEPLGRRGFQPLHQLRDIHRPRHSNGKVNVVRCTADPITLALRIAGHSCEIRVELCPNRVIENGLAPLRTEDHMNQNKRKRSGHCRDYRSGLQPSCVILNTTWGLSPRWYRTAPSALAGFSL